MADIKNEKALKTCLADLKKLTAKVPAEAQAAPAAAGLWTSIQALIAALEASPRDYSAILAAVIAILSQFSGPQPTGNGEINFAPAHGLFGGGAKIDWTKLIGILGKLLPLVIGVLGDTKPQAAKA